MLTESPYHPSQGGAALFFRSVFMLKTALNGLLAKKKKTPHCRVQLMQTSVIGEFS